MTSTQTKIEKLAAMIGTADLNEKETAFVQNLQAQLESGNVSRLSDARLDWLTDLHAKHFAD